VFVGLSRLADGLSRLTDAGLLRQRRVLESAQGVSVQIGGRRLVSFCSNDYLGLAAAPALVAAAHVALDEHGLGAGASHLVTGHHRLHETFESAFAAWVGKPAALLFSSGYQASLGVFPALLGHHDAIFCDRLNHASLNDAARLCGADLQRYRHGRLDELDARLAASQATIKLIASDLVFSMDGEVVDVDALLALAERHDAWLYLDDAHGYGVLEGGRGGLSPAARNSPRVIYLATFGKAAGVAGAAVAGEAVLVDWLVNTARTYVYTTAQPPCLAAALSASLQQIQAAAPQRARLMAHIDALRAGLRDLPRWQLLASSTPIQPLWVGESTCALALSEALREQGVLVPAIRPPTVPAGSARLRISLSAAHTEADIAVLVAALHDLAARGV
jgi:8-amino-7-oxononanoate synthase